MRNLKTILFDVAFTSLIPLAIFYPGIQWFSTFVLSFVCVFTAIVSFLILVNDDFKAVYFGLLDKLNRGILWEIYDHISNIIIISLLVYYNYKTASIALFITIFFNLMNKAKYKEYKKEKTNGN